ncbi:MAG: nitrous oxide-stimulated promoter family protein [Thermoflexaceae bacterium]|nr:nitrous oxide-stimulated promoter family protein [Thermoflexaceae bacterium]
MSAENMNHKADIEKKRQNEEKTLRLMIQIYCHGHHGKQREQKEALCEECWQLMDYAKMRIQKCPFMETKTFCSACKVHCYIPQKREKIREVMRYSGPRMLLYHPILAIKHAAVTLKEKQKEQGDVS